MKNSLFFTAFVLASILFFTGCKKENKIEKNLWKDGGKWNINSLVVNQVSTYTPDNYTQTIYEYGTIQFNKDGSGSFTITVDGDIEFFNTSYSNTESQLTIVNKTENAAITYDILEWEKNKMTIKVTDQFTSMGENITYSETLYLEKK